MTTLTSSKGNTGSTTTTSSTIGGQNLDQDVTFQALDLGFDNRILKGISRLNYIYPSFVQYQALPLGLQGKDLLIKAKTGSGKTATYGLLALHKVLTSKLAMNERTPGGKVRALILVPTRELVDQTTKAIDSLAYYCTDLVNIYGIGGTSNGGGSSNNETLAKLRELPDIIVSTPGKLIPYIQGKYSKYFSTASSSSSSSSSSSLLSATEMFIIDEADLVLSHGYKDDIHTIINYLPRLIQSILLSATLSTGLDDLKALVLHNPVILKVDDPYLALQTTGTGKNNPTTVTGLLTQLYVRIPRNDRYLLLYALIKLQLLVGKSLIFTNTTDTCVKIKLLLDKFSIPSAVLNAELPANSRAHIIDQFNKGIFDILLATDEGLRRSGGNNSTSNTTTTDESNTLDNDTVPPASAVDDNEAQHPEETTTVNTKTKKEKGTKGSKKRQRTVDEDIDTAEEIVNPSSTAKSGQSKKSSTTSSASSVPVESEEFEFLVSRGLDFKGVTTVINFDFPDNAISYIHRIGRTARGGASGVALSFLPPVGVETDKDQVLDELQRQQPLTLDTGAPQPTPFPFDIKEIETFRYRVDGIVRAITPHAVKEARLAELKRELLASQTLRAHFEDNPKDLAVLQHARPLHVNSLNNMLSNRGNMAHLKNVPTYLLPPSLKLAVEAAGGGLNASGIQTQPSKKSRSEKNKKNTTATNGNSSGNNSKRSSNDTGISSTAPLIPTDGSMPIITNPSDLIAVSKHEAYSARRVGSKMDPLRTFTYNAQQAASKGIPSMTSLVASSSSSSSSTGNYGGGTNPPRSSSNYGTGGGNGYGNSNGNYTNRRR